jgi:tetratricopeptide (TPR) repeat protein
LYAQGSFDAALKAFEAAMHDNPDTAIPNYNSALLYRQQGAYDKAIQEFNNCIVKGLRTVDVYLNRGHAFDFNGEWDKAIADYDESIQLNPSYIDIELPPFLKKAETIAPWLNPQAGESFLNRGNVYYQKGNLDKAMEDYSVVIQIKDCGKELRQVLNHNMANVYYDRGEFTKASIHYGSALMWSDLREWRGARSHLVNRGNVHYAEGKYLHAQWVSAKQQKNDKARTKDLLVQAQTAFTQALHNYNRALMIATSRGIRPEDTFAWPNLKEFYEKEIEFLSILEKKSIFSLIQELQSKSLRVELLVPCLVSPNTTALAERFWTKEGSKSCRLGKGTLKEIEDYLLTVLTHEGLQQKKQEVEQAIPAQKEEVRTVENPAKVASTLVVSPISVFKPELIERKPIPTQCKEVKQGLRATAAQEQILDAETGLYNSL